MKKAIILVFPLLILLGCKKGSEYALNEKVSKEFLVQMNALDEFDTKYFSDSSALAKSPSIENSVEIKDALQLSENASEAMKHVHGDSVSPEAIPFYLAATEFIDDVRAHGELAHDFFKETDPKLRQGYFEGVLRHSKKLKTKPDSVLAIQKLYFEKVGLNP